MGRRITIQESGGGGGTGNAHKEDPFDQPCFSAYNGSYNYSTGWFTWDHNLNVHNWIIGDNNGYSQYRSDNSSQNTEFINEQGSDNWFNTWNEPSSSTDRVNLICYAGYLGHQNFLNGSCRGSATPWFVHTNGSSYRSYGFRDVCTLPGETNQDYAVFVQWGGTLRMCQRSSSEYWMGYNYGKLPYVDVPDGWSNQMYGGGSYNRKTKKMVFMETNDSYTYQPWLWENVPNLRAVANNGGNFEYDHAERYSGYSTSSLQAYFNQTSNRKTGGYANSGYYDYASGKPTNQTTEDQRRCITVLCDNDRIVMFQMIPSYGAWACRWNSPTVDGNGNSGNLYTWNGTTSYGIDQGERYGARWTMTSDGRYIAMYCPYYYYGSGIFIAVTRVSDGKTLRSSWSTSSESVIPVPFGKSNFLMVSSRNTDGGQGIRFTQFNCDYRFGVGNDVSDPDMIGAIDASSYQFDSTYYTTSYPGIIPAIYNTSLFNTELDTDYTNAG